MDLMSLIVLLIFIGVLFGLIGNSNEYLIKYWTVFMFVRAQTLHGEGKLKLSKRQKKNDKAKGSFFE